MLTVLNRLAIRLGDTTDHGGRVVEVSSSTIIDGRHQARIGDVVSCPRCSGRQTIVEGDPTYTDDGIPVALEGHATSCGARLIASTGKG